MAGMPNIVLHRQVPYMAELVARADVGIGAGGAAMWERCYLGLPTITVKCADNQVRTTERSEERRAGKECVSTCRSRWWRYIERNKQQRINEQGQHKKHYNT